MDKPCTEGKLDAEYPVISWFCIACGQDTDMPPKPKASSHNSRKPIEQYDHKDKKRANNPPVGLVTLKTDQDKPAKKCAYDPHLDPQLVWAGKAERTSFEVPTAGNREPEDCRGGLNAEGQGPKYRLSPKGA